MDIRQVITDKIIMLLERGTTSAGRAIFTAASQAAKAADFILAFKLASAQLNRRRNAL